ncbi:dihydrolipoamide acetyltransferase family protein [Pseudonocardia alaniniphila]|uniref:Dihydrolipoamide acetyltransferase component of pyruvate dehydrogenase complex n=1 Tax=Pseudonocardia alaniniphila TaxID=75291 RepID=A0ABS9TPA5_9PSEU|nr:dihydrolipoamide acetyltransferase family protein [Pseudonocardia alaniniphila]MCH6170389.1 2-oxo acid dehydrogenase subunit E2 [Pseudonocardia alaniniphila]
MPDITMPRLSDTMEEGVISTWRKKVGDTITAGDVLVEIETDKAIMELEAYDDGVLERVLVGDGESAPIGTPIGVIGDGSGTAATPAEPALAAAPAPDAPEAEVPVGARPVEPAPEPSALPRDGRLLASPLARRLARERGVDLRNVRGTGPHGRVIRADIIAFAEATPGTAAETPGAQATSGAAGPGPVEVAPVPAPAGGSEAEQDVVEVPLSTMQRVAAARLTRSMQEAPHFFLISAVDVTDLIEFRTTLNATLAAAGGPKVSLNDLVVKAVATAVRARPEVNVSFAGDFLRRHLRVNVGVAVAVPAGLLVPVVRDADRKSVSEIAAETREKSVRARDGGLRADEMSGGTITVSNLGMYGIEQFTAVINPPEAVILAVGAAAEEIRPRGGEAVVRSILRLTLSCDHRVVDGATGALFLQTLVALLENPLRILA